ncbi:hypothetical protein C8R47DRAFT_926693, partial [Mycena vitilis]
HPLAVERMRYKSRYHRVEIPRDKRLCRFGCNETEDAGHAFFNCTASPALVKRRHELTELLVSKVPSLASLPTNNPTSLIKALVFRRDTVCQVAKFASHVFQIFD